MRHRLVAVVSSRNETVLHGRIVALRHNRVGLSIEWPASVMHSLECPASSCKVVLCCTYANVVVFSADLVHFLTVF